MLKHVTDPKQSAPKRVPQIAGMRLNRVQLLAGFPQRRFNGIQPALQPVNTGSLTADQRLRGGLLCLVPFTEETNDRAGNTRHPCDDADDDLSRH